MSTCRARLRNTSNALTFRMSGEQVFKSCLNRSESTAGSRRWSGSEFRTVGPVTESAAANSRTVDDIWQIADAADDQELRRLHYGSVNQIVGCAMARQVHTTALPCRRMRTRWNTLLTSATLDEVTDIHRVRKKRCHFIFCHNFAKS